MPLRVSLLLLRRRRLGVRDLVLPRRANDRGGGRHARPSPSRGSLSRSQESLALADPAAARVAATAVDLGARWCPPRRRSQGDRDVRSSRSLSRRLRLLRGRRGRPVRPCRFSQPLPPAEALPSTRRWRRRHATLAEHALGERRRRVSRELIFFFRATTRRVPRKSSSPSFRGYCSQNASADQGGSTRDRRRRRARRLVARFLDAARSARSRGAADGRYASRPDDPRQRRPRRTRASRSPRRRGSPPRRGSRRPTRRGRLDAGDAPQAPETAQAPSPPAYGVP